MTRIGRVKVYAWPADQASPCFRFVIENGLPWLACWRCVGVEYVDWSDPETKGARTIFERVS